MWVELADLLIKSSRMVSSVLEKGDFFREAAGAIEKALDLDPECGSAMLLRGHQRMMAAYGAGDDPDDGERLVRKALEAGLNTSEEANAWFLLGMARRTEGQEGKAKECFAEALKLDPACMPAMMAAQS